MKEDIYFVLSNNTAIFIGNYGDCLTLREGLCEFHKQKLKNGSWNAYFFPEREIRICNAFAYTGQPYYIIDQFFMWLDNEPDAKNEFENIVTWVKNNRKTSQSQWRFARENCGPKINKIYGKFARVCKDLEMDFEDYAINKAADDMLKLLVANECATPPSDWMLKHIERVQNRNPLDRIFIHGK
jgi:hypothetical protein